MSRALIHRGPDGTGEYRADHMALTMRRLSIIDLATGSQPLYDERRELVLIANGEIYNYVELRAQLQQRGHVFQTGSDCETILHLYQDHGDLCVHHLRGMFAFALWDGPRRRLLLARDRMGEKPLYLYERDGLLVFGSELGTLIQGGVAPFRLDPTAINAFFHYQYVPEPLSPIQGIRKLPAGHTLAIQVDPWSTQESVYWRMEDAPPIEGDASALIRAELETVSELTIRSDVPVGIALSGGLDSSAIAALAARKYPGTMHAFTAGYPGRPHSDERSAAEALAKHLGLPFHEVEITTDEIVKTFPEMVRWQDDPIADISGFGYRAIARAARDHGIPVLLQGQGGDELFWGYPWVTEAVKQSMRKARLQNSDVPRLRDYLEVTRPKPWPRRAVLEWLISGAGLRSSWGEYQRDRHGPRERLVFYDLTQHFRETASSLSWLYTRPMLESLTEGSPYDWFTRPRPWSRIDVEITRLICQTYLLENGIVQGDRLSMASSVELRLPLVDYRIVELVIGLRKARTDFGMPAKTWLKNAVADVVPDWVANRPKRGFQPPVRMWHRALFQAHGALLRDGHLVEHGILEPAAARQLSQGKFSIAETAPISYRALVLEVWCRQAQNQSVAVAAA